MPTLVKMIHDKGGLVYGDGANMNAVLGRARPGDVGVDVMQYQPAQDVHYAARRRRTGRGPGCFKNHLEPFRPHRSSSKPTAATGSTSKGRTAWAACAASTGSSA